MNKPGLYLETSIVSYLTARPAKDLNTAAHQQITVEWWDTKRKNFDIYISKVVNGEYMKATPIGAPLNAGNGGMEVIGLSANGDNILLYLPGKWFY